MLLGIIGLLLFSCVWAGDPQPETEEEPTGIRQQGVGQQVLPQEQLSTYSVPVTYPDGSNYYVYVDPVIARSIQNYGFQPVRNDGRSRQVLFGLGREFSPNFNYLQNVNTPINTGYQNIKTPSLGIYGRSLSPMMSPMTTPVDRSLPSGVNHSPPVVPPSILPYSLVQPDNLPLQETTSVLSKRPITVGKQIFLPLPSIRFTNSRSLPLEEQLAQFITNPNLVVNQVPLPPNTPNLRLGDNGLLLPIADPLLPVEPKSSGLPILTSESESSLIPNESILPMTIQESGIPLLPKIAPEQVGVSADVGSYPQLSVEPEIVPKLNQQKVPLPNIDQGVSVPQLQGANSQVPRFLTSNLLNWGFDRVPVVEQRPKTEKPLPLSDIPKSGVEQQVGENIQPPVPVVGQPNVPIVLKLLTVQQPTNYQAAPDVVNENSNNQLVPEIVDKPRDAPVGPGVVGQQTVIGSETTVPVIAKVVGQGLVNEQLPAVPGQVQTVVPGPSTPINLQVSPMPVIGEKSSRSVDPVISMVMMSMPTLE